MCHHPFQRHSRCLNKSEVLVVLDANGAYKLSELPSDSLLQQLKSSHPAVFTPNIPEGENTCGHRFSSYKPAFSLSKISDPASPVLSLATFRYFTTIDLKMAYY